MAKNTIPRGDTSVIRHIFISDSSSTTGAGKTALAFGDITAYYLYSGGTATALTIETITTLGTYAAPTSNAHLRLKLIHDTNMPGWYEIQMHNDWFSVASARKTCCLQLRATGAAPLNVEIDVVGLQMQTALNDLSAAQVNAEVVDALATDTYAEPASVPAATSSLKDKIAFIFTSLRNKATQTSTTTTLRNDTDSSDIGTSAVTKATGTVTRGKWS